MTKDDRPAVFLIQKLIHEQMYRDSKRIDGEETNLFYKREERKSDAEC
jgi:hypothetical protein